MPHRQPILVWTLVFILFLFIGIGLAKRGAYEHLIPQPLPTTTALSTPLANWQIIKPAKHQEIAGYAAADSVTPGQTLSVAVSANTSSFSATVYRLGWDDGNGAQPLLMLANQVANAETIPTASTQTGLVEPQWPYQLHVPISQNWSSGLYLIKLTTSTGYESYVPFVVRPPQPQSRILFVHANFTDQAYNDWGGNSLYHGSTADLHLTRAVAVSLRRPLRAGNGSGQLLNWEYPMVRFLEKNKYQMDYAADADIDAHPELLRRYKLVLIVGHDEYWTKAMRDGYEAAVSHGTNVAIFAANTAYRQIRIENNVEVNYKSAYQQDPLYGHDNSVVTVNWRNDPVNRPESTLIGAAYGAEVAQAFPFVVSNSQHWIYANTGLHDGDQIEKLVGYECDAVQTDLPQPAHLITLSTSPIIIKVGEEKSVGQTNVSNATIYTAPSGAMVFNGGTIQWSSGLDSFREHPAHVSTALQTITKNIIDRLSS